MKAPQIRSFLLAAALTATFSSSARAVDYLLTMDDLPAQPVHGLAHATGVEFGFTVGGVASLDATYALGGPGSIAFIQDPSIEGTSAGILYVGLPEPAYTVQFGVARSLLTPSNATVELFNVSNELIATRNVELTPMPMFAEGLFVYRGPSVSRFTVSFPSPATRFAFDNLLIRIIPEPASLVLACGGLGLMLCGGRLHRVRRTE